jgi:hypothetical protein
MIFFMTFLLLLAPGAAILPPFSAAKMELSKKEVPWRR